MSRASTWSFYDVATGAIAPGAITGAAAQVAANTPPGWAAVEGRFDHLSQRVNIATGQVIDWQPDAPPDDDLQTWQWDETTRRWKSAPTLGALKLACWERIKAARSSAEYAGFAWDASAFDSDALSQSRIQGGVQLALLALQGGNDPPFSLTWTLADNSVRSLSAEDMVAVGLALAAHVEAAFAHGRELREQIEAAESAEDLDAIAW